MMTEISYSGYRFPPEIIQQAIWRNITVERSDLAVKRVVMVAMWH